MSKRPTVSRQKLMKCLRRHFGVTEFKRRGKGSHILVVSSDGLKRVSIPKGDIRIGTLKSILSVLDISEDEFYSVF